MNGLQCLATRKESIQYTAFLHTLAVLTSHVATSPAHVTSCGATCSSSCSSVVLRTYVIAF